MSDDPRMAASNGAPSDVDQPSGHIQPAQLHENRTETKKATLTDWVWSTLQDVLSPTFIAVTIGLVVLVVVGLFGGWERAAAGRDTSLPTSTPDTPVQVDPFQITPLTARWATSLEPIAYAEPGKRYIMATFKVTNTSDLPVDIPLFKEAVTIDVEGLDAVVTPEGSIVRPYGVFRIDDGLPQTALQPGLEQKLVVIWRQDESAPLPKEMTVTLASHTYRVSMLGTGKSWLDATPAVEIALPVEEVKPS